jgi:hypothetical protein
LFESGEAINIASKRFKAEADDLDGGLDRRRDSCVLAAQAADQVVPAEVKAGAV